MLNDGRDGIKSWRNFMMRGVQKSSHQPHHKNHNYFRYRGIVERIYNFHLVMWNLCDWFYTINVHVVFLSRCSHLAHEKFVLKRDSERESFTDLIKNVRVECEIHRNEAESHIRERHYRAWGRKEGRKPPKRLRVVERKWGIERVTQRTNGKEMMENNVISKSNRMHTVKSKKHLKIVDVFRR